MHSTLYNYASIVTTFRGNQIHMHSLIMAGTVVQSVKEWTQRTHLKYCTILETQCDVYLQQNIVLFNHSFKGCILTR